jgi:uncharacterized oligopeptide transporter (OPT) family protein
MARDVDDIDPSVYFLTGQLLSSILLVYTTAEVVEYETQKRTAKWKRGQIATAVLFVLSILFAALNGIKAALSQLKRPISTSDSLLPLSHGDRSHGLANLL